MSERPKDCPLVCPVRTWCRIANAANEGTGMEVVLYGDPEKGSTGIVSEVMRRQASLNAQVANREIGSVEAASRQAQLDQERQLATGMVDMVDSMTQISSTPFDFEAMEKRCDGAIVEDAPYGQVGKVAVYCGSSALTEKQQLDSMMVY